MKTLDDAIEHVVGLLLEERDPVSIEKLANATQSLAYTKWQLLQPSYGASAIKETTTP